MNVALTQAWTIDRFVAWAGTQEERYEFDGVRPVLMTGGSARHNRIAMNLYSALRSRLRGKSFSVFALDMGVKTVNDAVRYPDGLVTLTKFPETDKLAPDALAVFEVLSPDSGRRDRIQKTREYAAIPSLRYYVILEARGAGLLLLHRSRSEDDWTALALTAADSLTMPELGIAIPVAEFYEDIVFEDGASGA